MGNNYLTASVMQASNHQSIAYQYIDLFFAISIIEIQLSLSLVFKILKYFPFIFFQSLMPVDCCFIENRNPAVTLSFQGKLKV